MMHKSTKIILAMVVFMLLTGIAQASDWPMFQHDPCHTGYTSDVVPDDLELIWTYDVGTVVSSPVVADGKVFVSSYDKSCCLDKDKGDLLWETEIKSWYSSTPAVADGKVFVGSNDAKIYCLDEDTGNLIWSYKTGDSVQSSPIVTDGKVFVGSDDAKIYCLDEDTGSLIWSYKTGDNVVASPAVAGGKVFVRSVDNKIYCLDKNNGDLIWTYRIIGGGWTRYSPVVAYGKVFVTSGEDRIYCLDENSGHVIWIYERPIECSWMDCTPAIADGKVFASTEDGSIVCLDANSGEEIWNICIGLRSYCSPAIANEKIFFGLEEGIIRWLNRINIYNDSWRYKTDYNPVSHPPAIADGKVFIEWGGKIHCFGKPTPTPTPTPLPTPLIDSDDDGVPDKYDYNPYDPDIQSWKDIKTPGFEAVFTIVGLLVVTYLFRRRR